MADQEEADQNEEEQEIDDYHKVGTGTADCPECGSELQVDHDVIEFSEFIYCGDCRLKFKRSRVPIVEDEKTIVEEEEDELPDVEIMNQGRHEKDEFVDYQCFECGDELQNRDHRVHELTEPDGEFEAVDTGMVGHGETLLNCPCGHYENIFFDIGEELVCECGRKYKLAVEENPEDDASE